MKINIQKVVKCLAVLLSVVAITFTSLSPSVYAVDFGRIYNPVDYVTDSYFDGDYKVFVFDFAETPRTTFRYVNGSLASSVPGTPAPSFYVDQGTPWTSASLKLMLFGVANSEYYPCQGGVLDIHKLTRGSSFRLNFFGNVAFNVATANFTSRVVFGVLRYDKDGNYLGLGYDGVTRDYSGTGGSFTQSVDLNVEINADGKTRYIAPYLQVYIEYTGPNEFSESSLSISIFNATYLADLGIALDDYNSILQEELNAKLDDIVSGGEAGGELNDAIGPSSPFGDASGDLGDAMGDFEDSSSNLPTTPSELPSGDSGIPTGPPPKDPSDVTGPAPTGPAAPDDPTVANPDSVEDYVDIAGNFFDWEASGLTYMYAPMVLSVTLAILFYTVFGKA